MLLIMSSLLNKYLLYFKIYIKHVIMYYTVNFMKILLLSGRYNQLMLALLKIVTFYLQLQSRGQSKLLLDGSNWQEHGLGFEGCIDNMERDNRL